MKYSDEYLYLCCLITAFQNSLFSIFPNIVGSSEIKTVCYELFKRVSLSWFFGSLCFKRFVLRLSTKVESSEFYAFSHWIIQTSIIFFIVWLIVFKTMYSPAFLIMSKVQRLRPSPMNSSTESPCLYCLDRYVSNDTFYGLLNSVGSSEFDSFTIESFGRVSASLLFAFQTIRTPTFLILPEVERLTPSPVN